MDSSNQGCHQEKEMNRKRFTTDDEVIGSMIDIETTRLVSTGRRLMKPKLAVGELNKTPVVYFRVMNIDDSRVHWCKLHLTDPPNKREPVPAFAGNFRTSICSTIVLSGYTLYSVGGYKDDEFMMDDTESEVDERSCRVHSIDILTQKTKTYPPMIAPRLKPHVQVVNGKIYVMGGESPAYYDPPLFAEVYDPSLGEWREFEVKNHPGKGVESLLNVRGEDDEHSFFQMVAVPSTSEILIMTDSSRFSYDTITGFLSELENSKPWPDVSNGEYEDLMPWPLTVIGKHVCALIDGQCAAVFDSSKGLELQYRINDLYYMNELVNRAVMVQMNHNFGDRLHVLWYDCRTYESELWCDSYRLAEICTEELGSKLSLEKISSICFSTGEAVELMSIMYDAFMVLEPNEGVAGGEQKDQGKGARGPGNLQALSK